MEIGTFIERALRTNLSQEQYGKCHENIQDKVVLAFKLKRLIQMSVALGVFADEVKREIFYLKDTNKETLPAFLDELQISFTVEECSNIHRGLLGPGFTVFHSIIGLLTESCELMEVMEAYLLEGKTLDLSNLMEEFGDQNWYLATGVKGISEFAGFSPEVIADKILDDNIEKLMKRYPEKFTPEDALARADKE